ncbi:hypothetical protein NL676_025491 [Syzygium grande]|nr:hypothetical protein NL676_025491 [Syzygium grande]
MLTKDGEVHVTHKTAHPFDKWEIEKLAEEPGLRLVEKARVPTAYRSTLNYRLFLLYARDDYTDGNALRQCSSKAMRIATEADEFQVFVCGNYNGNVISVAIRRPHRDQLVIIRESVDPAKLTRSSRRKFHAIAIVRVSNAGSTRRGTGYYSYDDHEHEHHERVQQYSLPSCYVPYPQYPVYKAVHHAPNPPSISTIM